MEHQAEHLPSVATLLWPAANFTIFVVLLVRGLAGPIREFFRARTERLRDELKAGDRARAEAEALRAQLAKDLADLPTLRQRLTDDLRATAERERDQMLATAKQTADRIRSDARLLAEQEVAAASRTLREEVVAAAVREATTLVQGAIRLKDHERLVGDLITTAEAAG